jgi:serine/threonine protein kinase/dipeptidyl aminopeptidase/acylaminoacyl peptidase
MALTPGTRLGPYEIVAAVGAGGMGEVYRARDTRLDRIVAIKILPESFAGDRERLERFQQEARILSTLNHPNLMAVYDVGVQDGMHFLVSEFFEGETLRERLEAGPLPQRRVIEYGLQIAKGLAAAHDKQIVHRDLKPENIFVLRDGRVKILDFGLAKQKVMAATVDATMTSPNQTSAGTVLGTAGYMSPEQVRGEAVDNRSDIFALGAILYEMIAGQRAFRGDSSVEVMTAILKQEPPELSESNTNVPLGLQRIVNRCLEKKPEARFQSASDLAFALDSLSNSGSTTSGGLRPLKDVEGKRSRVLLPVWLLAALAVGVLTTYFLYQPKVTHPEFTQISFTSAYLRHARFAPDGRTVVYDSTTNGQPTQLYSTRTDTIEAQLLNVPASLLNISPTGELAVTLDTIFDPKYTPTGRLARVPLGGGSTRELLDAVTDADWAPDGSGLAVSRHVGHHFRLEFPLGKTLYQNDGYISDVSFSPAGDQIAFINHAIYGDDRGTVEVVDLQGNRKVLTREFSSVQGLAWPPKGRQVWFTGSVNTEPNALRAVSLDGKERILLSSPVKLKLQDISKDGSVLLSVEDYRDQQLLSETAGGKVRDISSFPFQITNAFSADGKSLLLNTYVTGANSDYNLYTQRTDGSAPAMIGQGVGLTFSFDGKWVLAIDPLNLKHMRVIPTGVGEARTLESPAGTQYNGAAWMPDGRHILVLVNAQGQPPATYLQDVQTGAAQKFGSDGRYLWSIGEQGLGSVSPDGKSFITTDGENHFWAQPTDGSAPTAIKGLSPGDLPLEWHGGSQNIFFERMTGTDTSEIYDLNLATGQSKVWSRFIPSDKLAMVALRHPIITQDGAQVLYVVQRIFSTLFVASGIQ